MLTFKIRAFYEDAVPHLGAASFYFPTASPNLCRTALVGTLTEVDAAGRFLVNWGHRQTHGLNLEDDHFCIFSIRSQWSWLHFPSTGTLPRNEWGDLADDPEELVGQRACPPTLGTFGRPSRENHNPPEEQERGLMHWYRESDALSWKVKSCYFQCGTSRWAALGRGALPLDPLEGDELNRLTNYLSDGTSQ